jgi:hypothetical protein
MTGQRTRLLLPIKDLRLCLQKSCRRRRGAGHRHRLRREERPTAHVAQVHLQREDSGEGFLANESEGTQEAALLGARGAREVVGWLGQEEEEYDERMNQCEKLKSVSS